MEREERGSEAYGEERGREDGAGMSRGGESRSGEGGTGRRAEVLSGKNMLHFGRNSVI